MAGLNLATFGSAMGAEISVEQGLELGGYGFLGGSTLADLQMRPIESHDQVSLAPSGALTASQYMRMRYARAYEEPVRTLQPRPPTTPTFPAPGEASNSVGAYYRKKFAAFYDDDTDWKVIGASPVTTHPKEKIAGTTHITIEDLLLLIHVVLTEKERIQNLRSANPDTHVKVHDMDVLVGDLLTLSNRLDRREIREYQIPIRANVARNFLATFREAIVLPPLIDAVALPPTQFIPTVPTAPSSGGPSEKRNPDIVVLFQDVQKTRWELETAFDPSVQHYEDMITRLQEMERRIVSYAASDTPMPAELQMSFEDELRRLRSTFHRVAGSESTDAE